MRIGTSPFSYDSDSDGLSDGAEYHGISDPMTPDTDRDGLKDGQEAAFSSSAVKADSDLDGVEDMAEFELGSNPNGPDTDLDGIRDADEPNIDCDSDGVTAINDPDDDNDGLLDGDEQSSWRCNPDFDEDSVLDGLELNFLCITLKDCDMDGLDDGEESEFGADPLVGNSIQSDLSDGITIAFKNSDDMPEEDVDRDGIPDNWEETKTVFAWEDLQPSINRTDLLIEFVRVQDPYSMKIEHINLGAVYSEVERIFSEQGNIQVTWTETWINSTDLERGPMIPSGFSPYYEKHLPTTKYSANPYVTTVFLNPQHDQSKVLHAGSAPIRGMLASIDYGAHSNVKYGAGSSTVEMTPLWESIVDGERKDLVLEMGFIDSGFAGERMFLEHWDFTVYWTPYWYETNPVVVYDDGSSVRLYSPSWSVDVEGLTSTVLHEIGHTLGLCHTHVATCQENLTDRDQFRADESVMSYNHDGPLKFLESEWDTVRSYMTCPPQHAVSLRAENASASSQREAKYSYSLSNITSADVRECGEFIERAENLTYTDDTDTYVMTLTQVDAGSNGGLRTFAYVVTTMSIIFASGFALYRYPRTRLEKEEDSLVTDEKMTETGSFSQEPSQHFDHEEY